MLVDTYFRLIIVMIFLSYIVF